MSITGNSIYHITTLDNLKNILELKHFKINYCRETIETSNNNDYNYYFVPMVSFCDVSLSELKPIIENYDGYGIGLKKEWAEKNKLTPVIYIERNSNLIVSLKKQYEDNLKDYVTTEAASEGQLGLIDFYRHIKNYKGTLVRKNEKEELVVIPDYLFSNEREWRYCPTKHELGENHYLADTNLTHENIKDLKHYDKWKAEKEKLSKPISNLTLQYNLNDISCIIIKNEEEVKLINEILKSLTKNEELISILISKIITTNSFFKEL
ncbi:MAG TPA: abortive infection system antitoxin AbiGi family protein [Bacteroidia bacterium]|nr:abortive infection system antitoxin AbiGi family protein [Bacteroidia bacterium]